MAKNSDKPFKSIFRQVPKWQDLWFYQKSEVLYQMTYVFCERFLPQYGDRTVDQMVQAARSGKQNIVEGLEHTFVTQGGIKERMYQARTGYRQQQDNRMAELEHTISILRQQLVQAQDEAALWKAKYEDLKLRAINAYNQKNEEIEQLKNGQ